MVEASNPAQDMIDVTGHVVHEDVSYDKDVLEIKLPDTVVTSHYGGNFVKDVCIDEGLFPHRKVSAQKLLDEKSSPKFNFLMIDTKSDLYEGKGDARKSAHELKPETVLLPVGLAADGNTEQQCNAGYFAGGTNEKKISLEELLKLESAEEAQHRLDLKITEPQDRSTRSSKMSENHMPHLQGEAVGQVPINECHVFATASRNDELINSNNNASDSSATIPDRSDATAALDKPIETADSLCGSRESNEVGTAEARPDALTSSSSSSSDVQPPSEKSKDRHESFAVDDGEVIANAPDETSVPTSSSPTHLAEPSGDEHREKNDKKPDSNSGAATTDVQDSDQTDEENHRAGTTDDSKIGTSCAAEEQKDSSAAHVGEQDLPDNAKGRPPRAGNGYPFEPCSLGPSIMCNPVSTSGHMAYSGNVSVRSDSSTTSTRSFAFPVLQMDWTSSPVRMAAAERRRTRRRHDWRKGLLCWKF